MLRRHGLVAPLSSVLTFAEALFSVGLSNERALYWTGRSIFVHGPDEVVAYNTAFYTYWRTPPDSFGRERPPILVIAPTPSDAVTPEDDDGQVTSFGHRDEGVLPFSAAERLFRADLATLSDAELGEADPPCLRRSSESGMCDPLAGSARGAMDDWTFAEVLPLLSSVMVRSSESIISSGDNASAGSWCFATYPARWSPTPEQCCASHTCWPKAPHRSRSLQWVRASRA